VYYSIAGLAPRTDIDMGRHGFQINLHPRFKDLVKASNLGPEQIHNCLMNLGNQWLDDCGYGRRYERGEEPGDGLDRVYEARSSIRVSWGEWGPEHISVPGNACGLDIAHRALGSWLGGPSLLPHNIDSWSQVQLLLIIFTYLVDSMTICAWEEISKGRV
jgi:hypothetical protein